MICSTVFGVRSWNNWKVIEPLMPSAVSETVSFRLGLPVGIVAVNCAAAPPLVKVELLTATV